MLRFADFFRKNYIGVFRNVWVSSTFGPKIFDIPLLRKIEIKLAEYIDDLKLYHNLEPYNIPASIIKLCKTFISKPLTYIFNLSLSSGHFLLHKNCSKFIRYLNLVTENIFHVSLVLQSFPRSHKCSKNKVNKFI